MLLAFLARLLVAFLARVMNGHEERSEGNVFSMWNERMYS